MRFSAYVLLIVLTLQSFYRSILTVEYQINLAEYLAKCINKSSPELHCNGQCFLMKEIEDKEGGEATKNRVVYEYNSLYLHTVYTNTSLNPNRETVSRSCLTPYMVDYRFNYNSLIFRPPIA